MSGLSVVIPTHNRRPLLERAVASVLREGAEPVVVDDASTDDTSDYLDKAVGVTALRLHANGGPGRARNIGVTQCSQDLILFLDDDDELCSGGAKVAIDVAARWPDTDLFLHNCRFPGGKTTIPPTTPAMPLEYEEWLVGRFVGELKPVCRRRLFESYEYVDTLASGEGLLWGRVIKEQGAVVSGAPIIDYNAVGPDRLTSASGLLVRSVQNAAIAEQWLDEFGFDLRALNAEAWRNSVLAAATYQLTAGNALEARRHLRALHRDPVTAALAILSRLPRSVSRAAFLAHRHEVLETARAHRLKAALGIGRTKRA